MYLIVNLICNGSSDIETTVIDTNLIKNLDLVRRILGNSHKLISMYADDDDVYEEPTGEYKEIQDAVIPFPCYVEGFREIYYE